MFIEDGKAGISTNEAFAMLVAAQNPVSPPNARQYIIDIATARQPVPDQSNPEYLLEFTSALQTVCIDALTDYPALRGLVRDDVALLALEVDLITEYPS